MDWQPIETAPRDGTLILAFYRGQICVAGFLPVWHPDNLRWVVPAPKTPGDNQNGSTDIDHQSIGGVQLHDSAAPTHWMPLPPPPALATEAGTVETGTGSVHEGAGLQGNAQ